ncbi:hypothetical protein BsWGS_24267 [Bradybaena similaris]
MELDSVEWCCNPVTHAHLHHLYICLQSGVSDLEILAACRISVDCLKLDAEAHIKQESLDKAEECYNLALKALDTVIRHNPTIPVAPNQDLAIIWSNRSFVRCKQGKYADALKDAEISINIAGNYTKGYWRASQALKGLSQYAKAAYYLTIILSENISTDDFVCFMSELAILIPQIKSKEEWRTYENIAINTTSDLSIWMKILKKLFEHNEYEAVAILTTGLCDTCRLPTSVVHKLASVPGLNLESFSVGSMLKFLLEKEGTKAWHLKLAEFVVKRGASLSTVADVFMQPLLVIMTSLSIEAEVPSFMSLAWDVLSPVEYDEKDSHGNSPAHIVAKHVKYSKRTSEIICRDLLAHGCLTCERDGAGSLPHQYIPPTHIIHKQLKDATKGSGDGVLTRLKSIRELGNKALAEKDYDRAIGLYQKGLSITSYFNDLNTEAAILNSNISAVYMHKEEYSKAVEFADNSLKADPQFCKAYFRKGQALSKVGSHQSACKVFILGFHRSQEDFEKFKFSLEAAKILCNIPVADSGLIENVRPMLNSTWPKVIENLTQHGFWVEVSSLILGPPYDEIGRGIMSRYHAGGAVLSTVFAAITNQKLQNAPPLVAVLILLGAPPASLAASKNETHFHAAVRFCLLTNDIRVLHGILETDHGKDFQSSRDCEDRTPLHTLCIESAKIPAADRVSLQIVQMLFERKVDVNAKDKYHKLAVNYARINSPLKEYILDRINTESVFSKQGSAESWSSKSWNDMKEMGNVAFKQADYKKAVQLYSQAISKLESKMDGPMNVLSKEDGRSLAVLYGNRAECWHKQGNLPMFLDDAKSSVNADGSWSKGHWRVGKAFRDQGKGKKAIIAFLNALKALTASDGEGLPILILSDLVEVIYDQKDGREAHIEHLKSISFQHWHKLAYDFIVNLKWHLAEFIYRNFNPGAAPLKNCCLDLSPFCKMDKLDSQRWICGILLWFLVAGADHRSLKFHAGDTYFHATITIIVLSGSNPTLGNVLMDSEATRLLEYVVTNKVIPNGEINIRDDKQNTVLHLLATLKGPSGMRQFLAHYLLEQGVDVTAENIDKKQVLELVRNSDVIRKIVQENLSKHKLYDKLKDQKKPTNNIGQNQNQNKARDDVSQQKTSHECAVCEKRLDNASESHKKENYHEVFSNLVDVVNCNNSATTHHKDLVNMAVQRIAALLSYDVAHEIPPTLFKIHAAKFKDVLTAVAISGNWVQVEMLVDRFIQSKGQHAMSKFAKSLSLKDLVTDKSLVNREAVRMQLINLFVKHGATIDPAMSVSILEAAVRNLEWQVALKLLEIGADPRGMTLSAGDTPYHAALHVALIKDPGNFLLLEKVKHVYESSRANFPYLDVSCQDADRNTLLHIAARAKFSHHSLRAVELLCQWNVRADIKNKEDLLAVQYITSDKDRRAQYLKRSFGTHKLSKASKGSVKSESNYGVGSANKATGASVSPGISGTNVSSGISTTNVSSGISGKNVSADTAGTSVPSSTPGARVPTGARPKVFQHTSDAAPIWMEKAKIEKLLIGLPSFNYNFLTDDTSKEIQKDEDLDEDESEEGDSDVDRTAEFEASNDPEIADVIENKSSGEEVNVDAKAFEGLAWEVECTEDVWSVLKLKADKIKSSRDDKSVQKKVSKKAMSHDSKQLVVRYIYQLASGDWQPHLKQKVENTPDTLQLFKIALSRETCILWELAVAFSPRSQKDILLSEETGTPESSTTKTSKIYSEVIRVWSIVLEQSKLQHAIQKIVSSHERGKRCIIQKRIRVLSKTLVEQSSSQRHPVLYIEQDGDQTEPGEKQQGLQRYLFPPASAHKNEFHVLKFYSFSASLVSAVLDKLDAEVDFPFRVTDIEHAIISLTSTSPLLLLGRSGTGKTTCCLYRLWDIFQHYWEQAIDVGTPMLPRRNYPEVKENHVEENGGEVAAKHTEEGLVAPEFSPISKTDGESEDKGQIGESDDEDSNSESLDDTGALYDHLHQVFVTKNPVLCMEVQKSFVKLCNATDLKQRGNMNHNADLPNTIQDVADSTFPLFLTSRQLLLMLDASVDGDSFFPRNEDLALKVHIPGWGTQRDIFNAIPLEHDEFLDSDSDDDAHKNRSAGHGKRVRQVHNLGNQPELKAFAKRECTYEVFAYEVWPKLAKKSEIDCHPSLVWTEIMSFIKGSYESLYTEKGYLDKEEYIKLGRKRAPSFTGNRSQIYDIFLKYHNYKQQHSLFDEADLVYKLYCRLRMMSFHPWILHEIYVDETQDFTQAELALLVSLCSEPNKMFLTGDTAQSIMRGISFRFHDLRSLFFYTKKSANKKEGHLSSLKVPKKVHQLTHNYRSHTGILSLATAVLNILIELFPDSFDPLEKDQGMFEGPKPIIIESSSPGDLALLLTGSKRKTSHIEFGAHQAILVVNEKAKAELPEELGHGIVLTIFESKGLEFDDILIYNFFKDSHAKKEWRVVTDFLIKSVKAEATRDSMNGLVEIDADVLAQNKTRPLQFDATQHKILNSELKHLYTALTRARVNVWIFDEDNEKRAPMFEYFKARGLVKCMGTEECENVNEAIMFADKSTLKEWRLAGDKYMQRKLYTLAAKCYRLAEQPKKERVALAFQSALEASRMKTAPRAMREKYFSSGTQFVECGHLHQAAICFQNSHDFLLSALAFEKIGQFEEASGQYTRAQKPIDASRCLEQAGMFGRAIRVLVESEQFDRAIDCLRRYEMEVKKFKDARVPIPAVLIENKPSDVHSEGNLAYRAANAHFNRGETSKAIEAIQRSRNIEDQVVFLQEKELWEELAKILRNQGKTEQAALFMLKCGKTEKALEWAQQGFHKPLTAQIHLVMARKYEHLADSPEKIKTNASSALIVYTELQDYNGQALAKMMLGKHTKSLKQINEAHHDFTHAKPPNLAGALECFSILTTNKQDWSSVKDCMDAIKNISLGFSILDMLLNPTTENSDKHLACLSFYGFELDAMRQQVMWYPHLYPLCQDYLGLSHTQQRCVTLSKAEAIGALEKYFMSKIEKWAAMVRRWLEEQMFSHVQCILYKQGEPCSCKYMHRPYVSRHEEMEALKLLLCSVLLDYHMQTGMEKLEKNSVQSEARCAKMEETKWNSVEELIKFVLPDCPSALRSQQEHVHEIVQKVQTSKAVVDQLKRYFHYLWDNPGRVGRGVSQNIIKERCKSADWIVQVCFFASLFKLKIDVEAEVTELEKQLMSKPKHWIFKRFKYAIFAERSKDNSLIVEAIGSRFLESFHLLTKIPQDPHEALYPFTRMISGLGSRGNVSLMPQLDHLMFWTEFYLSLTWMFISKVNHSSGSKACFYLTSSYLSNMHLVSECIENSGWPPQTVLQILELHSVQRLQNRHILDRQGFIANFLVGHNKYSKFSLISQANQLCHNEQPNFLLAERILVLTALVLLNIPGQYVHGHLFEVPIRRELFKLTITKMMPRRLASLITGLKSASNYRDIAVAVVEFFHKQDNVKLMACQCLPQKSYSLQFCEAKLSDYPDLTFYEADIEEEALKTLQMDGNSYSQTGNVQYEDQEIPDELNEKDIERQEAKMRSTTEENRKKDAVKKIVTFFKSVVMHSRLRKKTYLSFETDEMFRPYTVKDSFCGICATKLELNEVQDYEGVETKDKKEKHCALPIHRQNLHNFEKFKEQYVSQVHHKHQEILRFLSVFKVVDNSPIYTDIQMFTMKILKAVQEFDSNLREIMTSRQWLMSEKVLDSFNSMTTCYTDNCEKIKKAFEEYKDDEEREPRNQDATFKESKEEDLTQEPVDLEPINSTKQPSDTRNSKSKRNRNQQKRHR